MNFYIGIDIKGLDFRKHNIRVDADLIDYLYKNKIKLEILYDIDPYDDMVLKEEQILKLSSDCQTLLKDDIITTKECVNVCWNMEDEPIVAFQKLQQICEKALKEKKNIISIGD